MPKYKYLTDENFGQAVAVCCAKTPKRVKKADHRVVADEALKRLKADLEANRDKLPMGCPIEVYEAHIDAAIDRVHGEMRAEHEGGRACGFGFIAIIGLIASLLSIWRSIREWLLSE